jgi:transcriptional regulator with XRE-family HTH domain
LNDTELRKQIKECIGKDIRKRRKKIGLSMDEFAVDCGLNAKFLGRVERGETMPSVHTMVKLSLGFQLEHYTILLEKVNTEIYHKLIENQKE